MLEHCSQKACSYSWSNRSIKKMDTPSLLKVADVSKEARVELLASEINICQSIHAIFRNMLSFAGLNDIEMGAKVFGDVFLLLMKIIMLMYIQLLRLGRTGT